MSIGLCPAVVSHAGQQRQRRVSACGIDCLEDPDILRRAKEEKDRRTGGRSYDPPIPPEVMPRIPKENA